MTTLSYLPDPAHLALKGLLEPITNLGLYVSGDVTDTDGDAKTIGAPLPYVVYAVTAPYSTSRRVGGWAGRDWDFVLTYVHGSDLGVKSVIAAVRGLLDGATLTIDGRERRIRRQYPEDPVTVEHDRVWSRPGGGSLYTADERWRIV